MPANPKLQRPNDEVLSAEHATAVALAEPPAEPARVAPPTTQAKSNGAAANASVAACTNCQAAMAKGQTFCPRCGFYPTLNTFVEVDPSAAVSEDGTAVAVPAKSHLEIWKSLIPRWAWLLIGGVCLLLMISFAARLTMPAGAARVAWTYAQFGVGISVAIGAHVACYMFAIMVNDTLSFVDIILKPIAIWSPTVHELPTSLKRVALGAWGLSAALFAALVVAGVNYNEIVDWGKVPPKKKAKKAVAAPIDAPADDKSLEEAIEDFADKGGVEMTDAERAKMKGNRQKIVKCLIIGFTPHRESDFDSLILAVEEGDKWRYAGVMGEGITVEGRAVLNRRMRALRRSTPAVPCDLKAFWLEPKLMCNVWYEDWTEDEQLKRPFFDKLAPDFEPVKKPASP